MLCSKRAEFSESNTVVTDAFFTAESIQQPVSCPAKWSFGNLGSKSVIKDSV